MNKTDEAKETELIKSVGDDIDPADLAARIKQKVRQKMESGFYDRKEVDRISKFNADIPEEIVESNHRHLHILNTNWDTLAPIEMDTHRGGIEGTITKIIKKLYQKFLHPLVKFSLVRQGRFNETVKELYRGDLLSSYPLCLRQPASGPHGEGDREDGGARNRCHRPSPECRGSCQLPSRCRQAGHLPEAGSGEASQHHKGWSAPPGPKQPGRRTTSYRG